MTKVEEYGISTACFIGYIIVVLIWDIFLFGGATYLVVFHDWSLCTYIFAMALGIYLGLDKILNNLGRENA